MSGLNPDLRASTDKVLRTFSQREVVAIERTRQITPKAFLKGAGDGFPTDIRLLGMFSLALLDYNAAPPRENFSVTNFPDSLTDLLVYGTERYIVQFMMAKYALIDISYSDGGLSISVDRVGKLKTVHDTMKDDWLRILENTKNGVLLAGGGLGLGTPRFQGTLSRMISMLGDGAMSWNVP